MKLDDAQELFKEIIDRCPALHRKNFLIILPEASPTNISEGYEVTIRVDAKALDDKTVNTLHEIATRRKLEVMEASESIMFYESTDRAKKLKRALEDLKNITYESHRGLYLHFYRKWDASSHKSHSMFNHLR